MDDEAVEYLTCRSTHRTGSTCGMKLGAAALPVERTGRVLDRLRLVSSDCIAVWCPRCRRATEYRYLTALESAA